MSLTLDHDVFAGRGATPMGPFDVVLAGLAVQAPAERIPAAARHGLRYRCRRCEVYGYVAPGEGVSCWACEDSAAIEPR